MATRDHDDDFLTSPVPAPDAEATPSERAHARTFADLVDKSLTGRPPAAMSADDRALLEVATVIRASHGEVVLPEARQRAIVEDALARAIGQVTADQAAGGAVTPIGAARRRRWVPWMIAGVSTAVAAAAVLLLWLRVPPTSIVTVETASVPVSWTSRPADPLIGPIAREHAGDASSRIDYIFADRLEGFRERRLTPTRGGTP